VRAIVRSVFCGAGLDVPLSVLDGVEGLTGPERTCAAALLAGAHSEWGHATNPEFERAFHLTMAHTVTTSPDQVPTVAFTGLARLLGELGVEPWTLRTALSRTRVDVAANLGHSESTLQYSHLEEAMCDLLVDHWDGAIADAPDEVLRVLLRTVLEHIRSWGIDRARVWRLAADVATAPLLGPRASNRCEDGGSHASGVERTHQPPTEADTGEVRMNPTINIAQVTAIVGEVGPAFEFVPHRQGPMNADELASNLEALTQAVAKAEKTLGLELDDFTRVAVIAALGRASKHFALTRTR
jgi:hypothetical protein